jgi:hypothetical protein
MYNGQGASLARFVFTTLAMRDWDTTCNGRGAAIALASMLAAVRK